MKKAKKKNSADNSLESKAYRLEKLMNLSQEIIEKEQHSHISFDDFLFAVSKYPQIHLRDIFQYFHDMVKHYVPEGVDEYPSPESIGFLKYDMQALFVDDCNDPFFADRLFANRFMALVNGFKSGIQNNHIYFFEGPPGSGKSTFLNNLLFKLEEYAKTFEGTIYKMSWRIDLSEFKNLSDDLQLENNKRKQKDKYIHIACPNNCHPILIVPKELRKDFLDELIPNKKFKNQLFNNKEYEWVFKNKPCAFCSSMYSKFLQLIDEPLKVYRMIYPCKMEFNRQFGKGISIFNPGDPLITNNYTDNDIQRLLYDIVKTNEIPYIYSYLAFTNNGVLALMDIKENNKTRLMNLHGIISDGVHKVEHIEERIKTLFIGVINPEDTSLYDNMKSFKDRVITMNIPYVLDFQTEVNIYKHKFGNEVVKSFMPRVLSNFAKIIISTRMKKTSKALENWLKRPEIYRNYVDNDLLLLRMELYTGKIPQWLLEEDAKNFTQQHRKALISETEFEGDRGISGRQSLTIFKKFISNFDLKEQSIRMIDLVNFVKNEPILMEQLPSGFLNSLNNLYEFNILEEVKESLYFYNEKKMMNDIKNYLYVLNFDLGTEVQSYYTGEVIEVTEEYLRNIESLIFGPSLSNAQHEKIRKEEHTTYITKTLTQEIKLKGLNIEETEQFQNLMRKYSDNLKRNALAPYEKNDNFKRCVEAYGTKAFNQFDDVLKEFVKRVFDNLKTKFSYIDSSAKYIILYVLENKLEERFKNFSLKN